MESICVQWSNEARCASHADGGPCSCASESTRLPAAPLHADVRHRLGAGWPAIAQSSALGTGPALSASFPGPWPRSASLFRSRNHLANASPGEGSVPRSLPMLGPLGEVQGRVLLREATACAWNADTRQPRARPFPCVAVAAGPRGEDVGAEVSLRPAAPGRGRRLAPRAAGHPSSPRPPSAHGLLPASGGGAGHAAVRESAGGLASSVTCTHTRTLVYAHAHDTRRHRCVQVHASLPDFSKLRRPPLSSSVKNARYRSHQDLSPSSLKSRARCCRRQDSVLFSWPSSIPSFTCPTSLSGRLWVGT